MVDYVRSTGTAGTLIIRDNGSTITFLISCSDPYTFVYGASWSGNVNGSRSGSFDFNQGAGTITIGSWGVSSNQTVSFGIGATGTQGLGGPTSFSQSINRASEPDRPTNVRVTERGHQVLTIAWDRGSMNGGSFTYDQIQISSTPQSGSGDFSSARTETTGSESYRFDELRQMVRYYIHVRSRNSEGWGPWSSIIQVETRGSGLVRINGAWREAVPYVKISGSWREAIAYVKINGTWRIAE